MSRNIQSIALTALLMLVTGCASQQSAPPSKPAVEQLSYDSPDAAVTALVTGVTAHDLPQLEKILGPDGSDVLDSGDEVADRLAGKKFVDAYNQKHSMTTNADGSQTLVIGDDEWPLPIPLVFDLHIDARVLAFTLGATLWEVTVDRRLFKGADDVDTLKRVYAADTPDATHLVAGYPPELWRVLKRSLGRGGSCSRMILSMCS